MSINRLGNWGGRGGHGKVFRYEKKHSNRVGSCDWHPQNGDLCIRVADAGDYFHNYVAIRKRDDGKFIQVGKFGAYVFGEEVCVLDERTFHLACAGEPVDLAI